MIISPPCLIRLDLTPKIVYYRPMRRKSVFVAIFLLIALMAWASRGDVRDYSIGAFHWMEGLGLFGSPVFVAAYALLTVFLIPTVLLTLGAGVLYGVVWGSLFVVAGISGGSIIAFLIGRHGFSDKFARYIRSHPKLKAVDVELVHEGFKVVLLSRLTPFFPGKLSNYFFGVAQFGLRDFFLGTLFGIIPFTVLNVYVGSLVGDLSQLSPNALQQSPLAWLGALIGVLAGAVLLHTIMRMTRMALRNSLNNRK